MPILLATKNIFSRPNTAEYEAAKANYIIHELGAAYAEKSIEEKWDQLMILFANSLSNPDNRSIFNRFREKRKEALANQNVLKLEDALLYIEHFYFLYSNQTSEYCLSTTERNTLLDNLLEAMSEGICEPGIVTRLENGLQAMRKDKDWILCELYQQRRLIIQQMADQFNAYYGIDNAHSIHTVRYMYQLAQNQSLGLDAENNLNDIYLHFYIRKGIESYFYNQYPVRFANYQKEIITNLSQHLMSEITQYFNNGKLNISNWQNRSIELPQALYPGFARLTQELLDVLPQTLLVEEYDENDDYHYYLADKNTFFQRVRTLVENKLVKKGLYINLDEIIRDNTASDHTALCSDVHLGDIIAFYKVLNDPNTNAQQIQQLLQNNKVIIEHYPTLQVESIIKTPALWQYLPKITRNNVELIDACVKQIDSLLIKAIDSHDINEVTRLTDRLWTIVKSNPDYLSTLSQRLRSEKSFALQLVTKDGMLLELMSDKLKQDDDVLRAASNNPFILQFKDDEDAKKRLADQFYDKALSVPKDLSIVPEFLAGKSSDRIKLYMRACLKPGHYKKIDVIHQLLNTPYISTGQLVRMGKWVTPIELIKIIKTRRLNDLPELQHCNEESLLQFEQAVNMDLWKNSSFLAVKRDITSWYIYDNHSEYMLSDYRNHVVKQCIVESNQWMMALIAYEKQIPSYDAAFRTLSDVLNQAKLTALQLSVLFSSIVKWNLLQLGRTFLGILAFSILEISALLIFILSAHLIKYSILNVGFLATSILLGTIFKYGTDFLFNRITSGTSWWLTTILAVALTLLTLATANTIYIAAFSSVMLTLNTVLFIIQASIKLTDVLLSNELSWAEAGNEAAIWFNELNMILPVIMQIRTVQDLFQHLNPWATSFIQSLRPWITRSFATLMLNTSENMTGEEALQWDVEKSIYRLLTHDEPSAIKKGEVLEALWEKVQADVKQSNGNLTYAAGLNKQYPIVVSGKPRDLSFWQVATTARCDINTFNPKAPDTRFSFFGLRGQSTTANQLRQHVDLDSRQDEVLDAPEQVAAEL